MYSDDISMLGVPNAVSRTLVTAGKVEAPKNILGASPHYYFILILSLLCFIFDLVSHFDRVYCVHKYAFNQCVPLQVIERGDIFTMFFSVEVINLRYCQPRCECNISIIVIISGHCCEASSHGSIVDLVPHEVCPTASLWRNTTSQTLFRRNSLK